MLCEWNFSKYGNWYSSYFSQVVDVSKSNTIDVSTSPKTIDVSSNTNVPLSPAPIQESTEDIKGDRIKINKKDKKKKIKKNGKTKVQWSRML